MKTVWNIAMRGQYGSYATLLILAFTAGIITATQPVLTGQILQILSGNEWDAARASILLLTCVFLCELVLQVLISLLQAHIGGRCGKKLRDHSLNLTVNSQQGIEGILPTGEIQNRVLTDSATAPYTFVNAVPAVLRSTTLLLSCIVGMAFVSLMLFDIVIGLVLLTALVVLQLSRWIRKSTHLSRTDAANYGIAVWNLLGSLKVYKSRNAEPEALRHISDKSETLRKSGIRTDISSSLVMPSLNLGTQIALVLSIGGAMWAMTSGRLSTGESVSFVMFMLYSLSPAVELGTLVSGAAQANVAAARLIEIWNQPQEKQGSALVPSSAKPSLVSSNLMYSYPGTELQVLSSINMRIEGPGLYLMHGSNGAGKSTFLALANGVLPAQGKIFVNGVDSSTLSRKSWRENVLLVDQQRAPFHGTLRDNIGAGLDINDNDRIQAMERTGFIKHYQDLNLKIGDDGVELSGGQRSLLAITDALVRKPQILLLDEISAGVDKETIPTLVTVIEQCAQQSLVVATTHDNILDKIPHRVIELDDLAAGVELRSRSL
ncbi:ATP-binding protein [Corynebacterium diphtheriae]|nr:ATP-binding protein [Corynebacterium diphtheriae] [Corynebacterium diphtheriae subsp. lausannense]QBZ29231.1 ABC transporter ATP-binding protein [Corynebacterium diphtheriae subsp. lausannense]